VGRENGCKEAKEGRREKGGRRKKGGKGAD
jgi:hypothetical protein